MTFCITLLKEAKDGGALMTTSSEYISITIPAPQLSLSMAKLDSHQSLWELEPWEMNYGLERDLHRLGVIMAMAP